MSRIDLEKIRIDGGTQMRVEIDTAVVDDYSERLAALPESDVFFDGGNYWLADGFHRYHAHRKTGEKELACKIHKGTQRDAILFAIGANREHGLRRSNADKKRAVETLLNDEEWGKKSANWIAEAAGVSVPFVSRLKASLLTVNSGLQSKLPESTVAAKDGRSMNVANIGKKNTKIEIFFDDADSPPPPSPKEKPKDTLGAIIEDSRIAEIFARRPEIVTLLHDLTRIKTTVLRAIEEKDGLFYRVDPAQFKASIEGARRQIRFSEPYAICAYCRGRNPNCRACKGQGWLSKEAHERFVPEDLKA